MSVLFCSWRTTGLWGALPPSVAWVITGERYVEETVQQLPELAKDHIVGEPVGRDTAACIGLGAALISRADPDAVMIVTPADHVIEPVQEFHRAVHAAEQIVNEHPSALVTFGISPTYPATGYGYIHRGPEITQRQNIAVYRVREFTEKPDAATAQRLLGTGADFGTAASLCGKRKHCWRVWNGASRSYTTRCCASSMPGPRPNVIRC